MDWAELRLRFLENVTDFVSKCDIEARRCMLAVDFKHAGGPRKIE
jgi:hypothetical protein